MKKSIKIFLVIILFIILTINNSIYAVEEDVCKVVLSANKTDLKAGDTVEISVKLSNITLENGITYIVGQLDYSQDVFEIVYEDDSVIEDAIDLDEMRDDLGYETLKVAYFDEDGWYLLLRRN